jgi:hypothetical protein
MNPLMIRSATPPSIGPLLPRISPSDTGKKETEFSYATQLLELPNTEICKRNISPQLLEVWSDNITSGIEKRIFFYSMLDGWSLKSLTDINCNDPIGHLLQTLIKCFKREKGSFLDFPDRKTHELIVLQLLQLDKALHIPEDHPAKCVLYKFMSAFVEQLALDKQVEKSHFLLPLHEIPLKSLLCFKMSEGWRCVDFDNLPKQPFKIVGININKTQTLLLDEKEDYIQHPAIIISSYPDSLLAANPLSEEFKSAFKKDYMKLDFVFYNGSSYINQSKKNSFAISVQIGISNATKEFLKIQEYNNNIEGEKDNKSCNITLNEKDSLTKLQKEECFEKVKEILSVFKEYIVKQHTESPDNSILIPLFVPQSQSDKVLIIYKVLSEFFKRHVVKISSNQEKQVSLFSEDEVAQISYIAEKLKPRFSKKEVDVLMLSEDAKQVDAETFEVKPQAVLDKLYNDIRERQAQCIRAELAKVQQKEEDVLIKDKQKELPSTAEAMEKSQQLEKAVEKERRRQLYLEEQSRMEKKTPPHISAIEEFQSKLELSSDQQIAVDSIYEGNPLKAKDFAALATALLQKVTAEDIKATSTTKRKGSHVKFHLKREKGSTGITFVVQHKKKDHKGSLKAQRDTLDHIFSL